MLNNNDNNSMHAPVQIIRKNIAECMKGTTIDVEAYHNDSLRHSVVFLPRQALNFMLLTFHLNLRTFVVTGASVPVVQLHMCVHIRAGSAKKLPIRWVNVPALLNFRSVELKLQCEIYIINARQVAAGRRGSEEKKINTRR